MNPLSGRIGYMLQTRFDTVVLQYFQKNIASYLLLLLMAIYVFVLYRTAWLSDDAYITYRSIENFVNGFGLTYNPGYRVQVFTHPLWALLHIPLRFMFNNMYFIGIGISMAVSSIAVFQLLVRSTHDDKQRMLLIACCISSAAFMDYSSSGLENPLTHLLLILFVWVFFSSLKGAKKLITLSSIMALILLNRMDAILMIVPMFALLLIQEWKIKRLPLVALCMSPFLLWELFSLTYYGLLFPSPAYAKLNLSMPKTELWQQGIFYVFDFIQHDPLSFLLILIGTSLPFLSQNKKYMPLSIGIMLYLMYTIYIGGDFMRGRFLSGPFVLSLMILIRSVKPQLSARLIPIVMILGLMGTSPPVLSHENFGNKSIKEAYISKNGITDERAFYFQGTGLIASKGRKMPTNEKVELGKNIKKNTNEFFVALTMGFNGFYAGPQKHLLDRYAITDPFLAQLPEVYQPNWRPGHYMRIIPSGYLESLQKHENHLEDPKLKVLYEVMLMLTYEPIWTRQRLITALKFNFTNKYSKLVNRKAYHLPIGASINEVELQNHFNDQISLFAEQGIEVMFSEPKALEELILDIQCNCEYVIGYRKNEKIIRGELMKIREGTKVLKKYRIKGPDQLISSFFIYPNTFQYPCVIAGIKLD